MPHQLAVRSGVIHPKYPAAPRQWVSYMGDQPGPGGAAMPPPSLGTGVQRDFSRRWGGDAESRFPRLDALGRAAALGAIGKVLSDGLAETDEGDASGPTAPTLPPPPSGGAPSGGSTPRTASSLPRTAPLPRASKSLPMKAQALKPMVEPLERGAASLKPMVEPLERGAASLKPIVEPLRRGAAPLKRASRALPRGVATGSEEESEVTQEDQSMYRHPLADAFKDDKPNPFAGPIGRGPSKRKENQEQTSPPLSAADSAAFLDDDADAAELDSRIDAILPLGSNVDAPDLASPALRRQQAVNEQRRKPSGKNALDNIKDALAEFEGYT
jgi:exonuclease VII small subunit